jgi:hypothetical protein
MDGHDFEFEEIHLPESVSLLLQAFDLVVGALTQVAQWRSDDHSRPAARFCVLRGDWRSE